jgi:predicted MFS family arabinose efflux permease
VTTAPETGTAEATAQSDLRRWTLIIGAGVLATTLSQPAVIRLPLQRLLKSDLQVSRQAMASFFAVAAAAWYFKPLAGILSDSVPIFGTRRRHYLLLSAAAASALWLLLGVVPRTYASLLGAVVAVNAMLVVGSTVAGALLVEAGQRYHATGRLTSTRYVVQNTCILLGGPLGGYLATRSLGLTTVVGAVAAVSVVPVAAVLLREVPGPGRRPAEAWAAAAAQLRELARDRPLWAAAGLLLLVYLAPGFQTPLYYYQTDTLNLSSGFIGGLGLVAGAFGLLGALLYGLLCVRVRLRPLLALGIVCSTAATLMYLFYRSGTAAILIEAQNGFFLTLAELPLMDLAARATRKGGEGLGFALMMSVRNGALALSDIIGSHLVDQYQIGFLHLVWLNAATTALVLLAVPFLPHALMDRSDGEPVP